MRRRHVVLAFASWPMRSLAETDAGVLAALRAGGVAVLLRHAVTEPGIGDPPGFKLGDCSTQRNLSEAGREQSRRIGGWFARHGLAPKRVRSSPWCRCVETARLAFGSAEPWAPLASIFGDAAQRDSRSATLRDALVALPARGFEVWVSHQVNISALTGVPLPMGAAVVMRGERQADGKPVTRVVGSLAFE